MGSKKEREVGPVARSEAIEPTDELSEILAVIKSLGLRRPAPPTPTVDELRRVLTRSGGVA